MPGFALCQKKLRQSAVDYSIASEGWERVKCPGDEK
jgi:hypothetical protein